MNVTVKQQRDRKRVKALDKIMKMIPILTVERSDEFNFVLFIF